jgi:DeoR/GlpR family transcriptional regulator of sugar metabolism
MKDAERLKFILETVRSLGFVSVEDVRKAFPDKTQATTWLDRDRKIISSLGLPIRFTATHFISMEPGTRRRTYGLRKELAKEKKQNLARAATALLAGHKHLGPVTKGLHKLMDDLSKARILANRNGGLDEGEEAETLESIKRAAQRLLNASSAAKNVQDLASSLAASNLGPLLARTKSARAARAQRNIPQLIVDGLEKSHRHLLLDSGTTTEAIALDLKEQHFWNGPPYLTVYTNAPRIESVLEDSAVEVVGLMGEVRKDTSARTGYWNQRSLALLKEIAIDVAMVGTTGLALEGQRIVGFACDSSDEALTKSQMLEIGTLRAVCADGSKLERATSSAFLFADADAAAVDVLITDFSATQGEARKHLTALAKEGILVVVGRDEGNLGWWDPEAKKLVE